ncbi:MAG: hypothetical protein COB53_13140 [Elusimicrobia bacterium]|nr:MAG: hypothetical protein COB53_13140 [Elusimicrobiota bacterium]
MEYIDPTIVAADNYKLLFENEKVRVIEMRMAPGTGDNKHSHRDQTVHFIKGGQIKVHLEDGTHIDWDFPDGHTVWHEAWTHRLENVGSTHLHAIILEPKD